MPALYLVHITAGSLALVSGYLALYSAKGATLHRKSGMLFVYAMLTMCLAGFTLAVVRDAAPGVNVPAALLTAYLVTTSLTTVRPPADAATARALHIAGMLLVLGVSLANATFGWQAIANGGRRAGIPAFPFVMFSVVGLLAFAGDVRLLRRRSTALPLQSALQLQGAARLTRHLWRMSFALLIAAMSFFLGQAKVIPKPIRIAPLLALPVVAVLVTMLYWLWRVRVKRSLRGMLVRVNPSLISPTT
jgi:uncharacterized membrane protein